MAVSPWFPYTRSNMEKNGIAVIYVLKHPKTKKIFYVGSTRHGPAAALWRHLHWVATARPSKARVVRKLKKRNLVPLIEVVCSCPVADQFKEEKKWIRRLRRKHKLTNIVCM